MTAILNSRTMAALLVALFAANACQEKPRAPAEKAGEAADSAIEETTQGHKDLGDGPLENAGERLDEATQPAR